MTKQLMWPAVALLAHRPGLRWDRRSARVVAKRGVST
jgi:hypothetical protein